MKKVILKILPYLMSFAFGLVLYVIAIKLSEDAKSLFINISSAFISIPLLYLIYELTQQASKKKLNKEIFEYAKMNIDKEFLNICHQIIKLIYPYERQNKSFEGIKVLLNVTMNDIKNEFEKSKYVGFQVLKNWYVNENKIQKLIDSTFILGKLSDDQVISIIDVLKNVRAIQNLYRDIDDLFVFSEDKIKGFKIESGLKINSENSEYPDRILLLKEIANNQFQVFDYGDFEKFKTPKLLLQCELNPKYVNLFSEVVYDTLTSINYWLDETGIEFLIDTRMYKIHKNKKSV
ncbi:MAG: hypothetical protein RDU14_02520 [Melioribacteraceae bacterium]|nr:hypothetical protein [Melioribacteraceae bacterium]